eukprot:TRINITY_DN1875_c0_g2_i3.p1 TRINITY_DN1875_c0_g2~~TRINITY_DN1875_c0_g2_i3.p1  ORF type:complete len:803 (-),score=273.94 TRINITY_DN1875_c0_g2_i3:134-2542(-)
MRPGFGPTTPAGPPGKGVKPVAPQFFVDPKKGEVNELKILLKNCLSEKDEKKRRDVVKKVIAFMTLGIDVSRLFTEMCMASATSDMIQKKMIYLYLANYAESNASLAIMAINTYLKDCKAADGKTRGLALRSLCSLRFSGAYEYLQPAILEGMRDLDSYVRKTAIMGCVKVYHMNPSLIRNSNIIDTLYGLIKDPDNQVATNAIIALDEILESEGGIAISQKMIVYLLNKIREFNEWGQTLILELVAKYKPKSENELFDILNLLEDRLKHATSCIVLGTIKIFLGYTVDNPVILKHVYERITSPLLTLMSSGEVTGSFEIAYIVVSHIHFIVARGGAEHFEREYKQFYCKTDEPTYLKYLKVDVLSLIATENNLGDILNELQEYVSDIDSELARRSIRAIGAIGLRVSSVIGAIIKQLASFLSISFDYITNETIIAFMNILRKYRSEFREIINVVPNCIESVSETEAKVALLWILGEYAQEIEEAPYILEYFIGNLKEGDESQRYKHALLAATVKTFVKKPPETYEALASLLNAILNNENEDIDLKDRAAFYVRVLQTSVDDYKNFATKPAIGIDSFVEDEELIKEKGSWEFNTLSVIYNKPKTKFVKPVEYFINQRNKEMLADMKGDGAEEEQQQQQQGEDVTSPTREAAAPNLLDLGDLTITSPTQPTQPVAAGGSASFTVEELSPFFELDPERFQSAWTDLPECANVTRSLSSAGAANMQSVEQTFAECRFFCIASGEMENQLKFYFYGRLNATNELIFIEVLVDLGARTIHMLFKAEREDLHGLVKFLETVLRTRLII